VNLFLAVAASPTASPTPVSPFGPTIIHFNFLLSTLIWAPIVVGLLLATLPNPRGRFDRTIVQIAFWTNAGLAFLTLVAYNQANLFSSAPQYEENLPWMPALGVNYHLGVDGVTIPLLFLGSIVGVVAVLASTGIRERVREYFVLLLLVEGTVNGVLCARDMFLLVTFWGAGVLPVALLLAGWGGPLRRLAAGRYLAYGAVGTAALAAVALILYGTTGGISFDFDFLVHANLDTRLQVLIGLLLLVVAATRLPLVPLHGWARDVFGEATPGVAVLVAGITARLGGYLLIRLLVAAQHDGATVLAPILAFLSAATVLYAAVMMLRTRDLRRFGAYGALIPGGVFGLGIAGLTALGLLGAVLQLIAGGLAAALIVGATATISERAQTRDMALMGGLASRMPKLAWLLVLAGLAMVGVPGFASFIGEAFSLFGAFATQPGAVFVIGAGLALALAGIAITFQRVLFGPVRADAPGASDASLQEMWYLGLMVGVLLWWGIFPSGPKLGGSVTIFDEGVVNVINNSSADIMSSYPPAPGQ
jgi:NADH-quinone oxidoreductase subunit M